MQKKLSTFLDVDKPKLLDSFSDQNALFRIYSYKTFVRVIPCLMSMTALRMHEVQDECCFSDPRILSSG